MQKIMDENEKLPTCEKLRIWHIGATTDNWL